MSDIDDELLALAGGGDVSSDEDEPSNTGSRERSRSPPETKESSSAGGATKKSVARKSHSAQDSEEEGEASDAPSSPNSLQSAPMDESDSDSEAPESKGRADDETKYPVDGLFMSQAEKQEIMSMREVEREQILAEREQEKERLRQNQILRQLVTNQEKAEKHKKRKASAADLEDTQRKTSRARTKIGGTRVGETNSALDALKRARAEKSDRMRRRENERRRERSPFERSSSVVSGDSDVEWSVSKSKRRSPTPEVREAPLAELRDVERIRMSRTRFAKVCFYPGFADAVTGCYVRISIGPNPDTKQNVYRVAVIKAVNTGRGYALEDDRGKTLVTEQYISAAHGKAVREWPFFSCSESPFTEAEWNRYVATCKYDGVPLPKKPALLNKAEDLNNLVNRQWTEEELTEKLGKQRRLKDRYSGADRQKLENQLVRAKATGDDELANKLEEKIDKFEMPRLAFKTSLNTKKTSSSSRAHHQTQQERLAEVNRANRRLNQEQVRKAQIKERHKARELQAALERGEEVEEDLSKRVKTRIKFTYDVHEDSAKPPASSQNSGASTPANAGTPRAKPQRQAVLPQLAKLQQAKSVDKHGLPTIHKSLTDDDIIGALDLDIDVDIE